MENDVTGEMVIKTLSRVGKVGLSAKTSQTPVL